jgi:TonB-linked SusC/RagA family outer membrane protein
MKTIYKKLLFLLLMLPLGVLAQTLEGTVVDAKSKKPISGANVVVQGAQMSVQTDSDGNFKLTKLKKGDVLSFSYVGYKKETLEYNNQKTVTVSLEEEANTLQEVVVQVGYGSIKKKDATGSVALITTKDFNKGAITNTENLINGRVAGVNVTQGGRPGDGAAIRIRSGASFAASNDPLIVIDGLPVDKGLSSINPNDIESFSILKDASATAIYGSRGSNGVILIKTKKGSKGATNFSFNSMTTINNVAKKVDVYSADEYRNLIRTYVPTRASLLQAYNTDWQDEIYGTGVTSDNNFSVRGNLLKVLPARLSLGYTKIDGVLRTSMFDRKTVALSLTPSLLDNHLKFEINANYAFEKNRYADEGAIGSAVSANPTYPVYDYTQPFGGYYQQYDASAPNYTFLGASNPLALLEQRHNYDRNNRFYGNIQTEYKLHFFPDLKVVWNLGIDKNSKKGHDMTDAISRSGWFNGTGVSQFLGNDSNTWEEAENKVSDVYLNYNKKFGSIKFDLTGGYSWQNFESERFYSGNTLVATVTPVQPAVNSDVVTATTVNLQAFYGRANIDISEKYLFTFNYRHDGTSRFSEENRWGDFFGGAFAWRISNENFLKNSKTISDLKLRLGLGTTGQQDLRDYNFDYVRRYILSGATSGATYPFGGTYYLLGRPEGFNPNLKWEETRTLNAGLDFGFANNRLTGSIDVFEKKSNDLIAFVVEPSLSNFRTQGPRNVGNINTKGIELGLNYKAIQSDKQNLTFSYNVSYNKQEVKDIAGSFFDTGSVGLDINVQRVQEGLAPYAFWVYEQVYDANGRPIEGMYVDRNGDGTITSADKYAYKKPAPDVTMGFMVNYNYKQWDFSTAFRSSIGNYVYDNVSGSRSFLSQSISDNNTNVINNATTDFDTTGFVIKRPESDYYVKNASWFKWDNFTVGYTLDNPLGTTKNSSLRLYTGAQNILVVSKYKGMDPEIFGGIDSTIYPRARMYILGLNFNF